MWEHTGGSGVCVCVFSFSLCPWHKFEKIDSIKLVWDWKWVQGHLAFWVRKPLINTGEHEERKNGSCVGRVWDNISAWSFTLMKKSEIVPSLLLYYYTVSLYDYNQVCSWRGFIPKIYTLHFNHNQSCICLLII